MTAAPTVDVCMPTTGREDFLGSAVESVLAQTYPSWRLTISSDGPLDGPAAALLEGYAVDPRITLRDTGHKVGAPGNITALLAAARGDYVLVLHDDDRLRPTAIADRVAFMEARPECGLVFSPHLDIDRDGKAGARRPHPYPPGMLDRDAVLRDLARFNVVVAMHGALVRRSALELAGAYTDGRFPRLYDWELWIRLASGCSLGYIEAYGAEYRIHGDQTAAGRRDAGEFLELFEHGERLTAAAGHGPALSPRERGARMSQLHLAVALDGAEQGRRREALASLRRAASHRPVAVVRPRFLAALAVTALGRPGARMLAAARSWAHARQLEL